VQRSGEVLMKRRSVPKAGQRDPLSVGFAHRRMHPAKNQRSYSMLKHLIGGLAAMAILAVAPARADILGGLDFDASGAIILNAPTLTAPGQQVTNLPCIICGANQPQQPTGFGYNLFGNTGNADTVSFFSTSLVPGGGGSGLAIDQLGLGYSILDGSPLLSAIGGRIEFSIGIDMNQSNTAQTLESFWFLNLTQQTVLAVFSPGPGGVLLPTIQNGTGFPDYTLSGLTLAGINPGDDVMFYARITGANDGPDSFFLIPNAAAVPGPIAGAGVPGLIAAAFALLALRRRKQNLAAV